MLKQVPPKTFVAILFTLLLLPVAKVLAQPDQPQLESMKVALWPEFDRPEVLVVTHLQLKANSILPAPLTLQLPGYLDQMYAVAEEKEGGLVNVPPTQIEYRHDGDFLFLSFPATETGIQLEYYDPAILTKDGATRQLDYKFFAPANLDSVEFEIQQPAGSRDFALTPAAESTFAGSNGLTYSALTARNLKAGDTFAISATYQRTTNALSVESLASPAPAAAPAQSASISPYWAYGLLGAGVLLLVGVGGYWWRQNRTSSGTRRQPHRKSARPRKNSAPRSTINYCFNCGSKLRPNALFCHACGAEQRQN